jgi:hypothetical protein
MRVPPFDPDAPRVGSIHLFHLLYDDLELLHLLAGAGIETVGQWRLLAARGQADKVATKGRSDRLEALVELVESFLEGWRIGRGREVDADVLHEAGVSPSFLDRLASLATDLGGDARRLIQALEDRADERVKGFRAKGKDALCAFLEMHDYLDMRDVLDEDGLRAHVLTGVANHLQAERLTPGEVAARVDRLFRLSRGQSNGVSEAGGGRVAPETPLA